MVSIGRRKMECSPKPKHAAGCRSTQDQNNNSLNAATEFWLSCIREWYPERRSKTLFYSPLHFNRVPYSVRTVNGQTALVPQAASTLLKPVSPRYETRDWVSGKVFTQAIVKEDKKATLNDSNIRDDQAVELLRNCVEALSKVSPQVMMAIFGLNFDKYLRDETSDLPLSGLITPASMEVKRDRRGDFDMLIIHRTHGLIVCEIKSVGAVPCPNRFQKIRARLVKAAEQLTKAERVLRHLTEDLGRIPIKPSLFLPHVAPQELRDLMQADSQLLQTLSQALHTQSMEDTLEYCLCQDRIPPANLLQTLSNPQPGAKVAGVEEETRGLQDWWNTITRDRAEADSLTDDLYDHLLARFCGPATSVEVPSVTRPRRVLRTEGQAAAETSRAFAVLTLHEEQVRLLNDPDLRSVHLYGPPGTGKTLVLTLKACEWLLQGKDVQVLNVLGQKRAVSFLIEKQLQDFVDKLRKSSPDGCCNRRSNRAGLPRGGQRWNSRHVKGNQRQPGSPVASETRTSKGLITAVDLNKVSGNSKDLITAAELNKVSGAACVGGPGTPELGEQSMSRPHLPTVALHMYDFLHDTDDLDKALREMVARVRDDELHVIADEVLDLHCRVSLAEFCQRLKELVPRLRMWTVDTEQLKVKVPWVREKFLTIPLRSPPTVTREVQMCKEISTYKFILPYTEPQLPVPTQGPPVKWLPHDQGAGHPTTDPENCSLCALSVARFLKRITSEKDGPQYRDIFVLCQNPYVDDDASTAGHNGFSDTAKSDDVTDGVTDLDLAASRTPDPLAIARKRTPYAVTQALRASHLPYRVVTHATATTPELRDLALAVSDVIVVSDYSSVSGLERAVVVVFGHGCPAQELVKEVHEETINDCGRFFTMSRCTGQLVWVGTPPL